MGAGSVVTRADRGYYDGDQILACEKAGIAALVPKPDTSPARAKVQWSKDDFVYEPESDTYRCPMGERLTQRFSSVEEGKTLRIYFNTAEGQVCGKGAARRVASVAFAAGSMKRCSKPCRSALTRHPTPCTSADAPSSMSSPPSNIGWARRTLRRRG